MRRPGIATIGSIGLHAAVVALALIPWPRKDAPVMVSSVPVSIVSSEVAAAAPADNPSDELVDAEALEALQELLDTEALLEEIPEVPTPPQPRPPEPSPERADTIVPMPAALAASSAAWASVTVPAWLTLISAAFTVRSAAASAMRAASVTR